jgi:hypothetical protein
VHFFHHPLLNFVAAHAVNKEGRRSWAAENMTDFVVAVPDGRAAASMTDIVVAAGAGADGRAAAGMTDVVVAAAAGRRGRSPSSTPPCAACKLLRRRCKPDCVFAPYFPGGEPHRFASVHKVFGTSSARKIIQVPYVLHARMSRAPPCSRSSRRCHTLFRACAHDALPLRWRWIRAP